jgi:hypothetical protein
MIKLRSAAPLLIAASLGLLIGLIDSQPAWDDTGITVAALVLVSAVGGAAQPRTAWACGLLVGMWVPLLNAVRFQNFAAAPALLIALVAALIGAGMRQAFARSRVPGR